MENDEYNKINQLLQSEDHSNVIIGMNIAISQGLNVDYLVDYYMSLPIKFRNDNIESGETILWIGNYAICQVLDFCPPNVFQPEDNRLCQTELWENNKGYIMYIPHMLPSLGYYKKLYIRLIIGLILDYITFDEMIEIYDKDANWNRLFLNINEDEFRRRNV